MTLEEIKAAIEAGKTVYWKQDNYPVKKCENNDYVIVCTLNDHTIGLTWRGGKTLNGKEEDFYTRGSRIHSRHAISPDGELYWQGKYDRSMKTIREKYAWTHREINSGKELCATLRAGEYAWPGGYQMVLIADDGGFLHFDCVRDNLYSCIHSIRHEINDGWRIIGCDILENYEEDMPHCDHCGEAFFDGDEYNHD